MSFQLPAFFRPNGLIIFSFALFPFFVSFFLDFFLFACLNLLYLSDLYVFLASVFFFGSLVSCTCFFFLFADIMPSSYKYNKEPPT